MSIYQYYEFQAVDRPLTPEEQEAVAQLSSRVHPHPRRAVFVYHWSDFPGRAEEVLAQYYDAMLYVASWGSKQLMFRLRAAALDLESVRAYCQPRYVEDFIRFSTRGEHVILDITFHEEGSWSLVAGEGWLDALLPLRDDILRGDYRALYLAWLKTLEVEEVLDVVTEPPPPPGLRQLSPALRRFIELFEIDEGLVQVAAETSGDRATTSDRWVRQAIARLARTEADDFLLRLAQGEAHLPLALQKRLRELAGADAENQSAPAPRRSVGQLLDGVKRWRERERHRQAAEAEWRRIEALEGLAKREVQAWEEVDALIQRGQANSYDQATGLLGQLKELAAFQRREVEFEARVGEIVERYPRRQALLKRLRRAELV